MAQSITRGASHAGVRLDYEGLEVGGKGVVRFTLTSMKNWGGAAGGVANVVAYYVQNNTLEMVQSTVSSSVKGGADGATQESKSDAASLLIPVSLKEAEVRAYIGHDVTDGVLLLDKLADTINDTVEKATNGLVKKPITTGSSLGQVVAPAGGDKLTF